MDDERILESERYQIEQIRELESEELQIEEVEDHNNSSSDEANDGGYRRVSTSSEFTFNTTLASLHTYLGEVEDTRHRVAFLDSGAILTLPLFFLEGVVLFPQSTLPLRVIDAHLLVVLEKALNQVDAPYTIGVVRIHRDPDSTRSRLATIGTTAEIRQYRRLEDGSFNVLTRGQQRFRLRRCWIDEEGAPCGEVQIIQEDLPLRTPRDVFGRVAPLSNLHGSSFSHKSPLNASRVKSHGHENEDEDSEVLSELSPSEMRFHPSANDSCHGYDMVDESTSSDDDKFVCESDFELGRSHGNEPMESSHDEDEKRSDEAGVGTAKRSISVQHCCKGTKWEKGHLISDLNWVRRAPRAFWPYWVYSMYDSYCLGQRAADLWKQIIGVPNLDVLAKRKPDVLSFYIASKIPVSESIRQELLEIDGISYRLRREIELLESFDRVRCKNCQIVVARRTDMLVMSNEGPLGAYVNFHGFVHEVMTLQKANGLALIGSPQKEYSWFPGYAWTIATCSTCETQLGWLYTATNKKLKPKSFWGIRSSKVADDMR